MRGSDEMRGKANGLRAGLRLTRREALLGLTAAWTVTGPFGASLALADAPTEKRFVVVLLRGALDGLSAVVPYGDPNLKELRGPLVPPNPGGDGGMLDLGGYFGLHPALTGMHAMYAAGEMLPVHAVAGPYRSRSHFDAQDMLESGADHRMTSGWLNRAVEVLPRAKSGSELALAVGISMPLLLRGPASVGAYAPLSVAQPTPDLFARVMELNHDDPLLGPALQAALRERGFAQGVLAQGDDEAGMGGAMQAAGAGAPGSMSGPGLAGRGTAGPGMAGRGMAGSDMEPKRPASRYAFPALAGTAGKLLAAADGPRVAALEVLGWDTHAGQDARLVVPLRQLDQGLAAMKAALGPAWRQTVVLVVTEFGRTVRINGTKGTDHGTGTVAFVAGGSVAGGKVLTNWPGLAPNQLYQNRDLMPTLELRSLAKGLLAAHLGIAQASLGQVFPDSAAAPTLTGLLRA